MYVDQGVQFFQKLYEKIGDQKWTDFILTLRSQSDKDEDYK